MVVREGVFTLFKTRLLPLTMPTKSRTLPLFERENQNGISCISYFSTFRQQSNMEINFLVKFNGTIAVVFLHLVSKPT